MRHVAFLRTGGIEFQHFDVVRPGENSRSPRFNAWILEQEIIEALETCASLTAEGLLPLPVLIQATLLEVSGTVLYGHPGAEPERPRAIQDESVTIGPYLLNAWGEPAIELSRRIFNEIWQSWGIAQSWNYERDGSRRWYGETGDRLRNRPVTLS